MSDIIYTCPECGANSNEYRSSMFEPSESIIRNHDDWLECKKCGHTWDKEPPAREPYFSPREA